MMRIIEKFKSEYRSFFHLFFDCLSIECRWRLSRYASEGVEQRLQAVRDDITRAEAAINKIKDFIVDYQRKISEADKKESESKSDLRNVNDNIRFRKESIALAKISEEIDSLGLDEAKAASVDYEKRYRLLEDEVTELQAKVSTFDFWKFG